MSMTKNFYHDAICAMSEMNDEEYLAFFVENEKAIDWFSDQRLAHDGFSENDSELQREIIDEDLPF